VYRDFPVIIILVETEMTYFKHYEWW